MGTLRRRIRRLAVRSPLGAVAGWAGRRWAGGASAFLYHRVTFRRRAGFEGNAVIEVAPDRFERQIAFLATSHRCLSLPDATDLLRDGRLPERAAIVTFDDGYRDNLLAALPILERHGVPATVYVTTGLVDGSVRPWWYELEEILSRRSELTVRCDGSLLRWDLGSARAKTRAFADLSRSARGGDQAAFARLLEAVHDVAGEGNGGAPRSSTATPRTSNATADQADIGQEKLFLSWDEIATLDAHPLITIGAHTMTHPALARLEADAARAELAGAKAVLERRLGHPIEHLAYPFGTPAEAGPREFALAAAVGYRTAFTTTIGHLRVDGAVNLHALPRIPVDGADTDRDLAFKASGAWALLSGAMRGR